MSIRILAPAHYPTTIWVEFSGSPAYIATITFFYVCEGTTLTPHKISVWVKCVHCLLMLQLKNCGPIWGIIILSSSFFHVTYLFGTRQNTWFLKIIQTLAELFKDWFQVGLPVPPPPSSVIKVSSFGIPPPPPLSDDVINLRPLIRSHVC